MKMFLHTTYECSFTTVKSTAGLGYVKLNKDTF